MDVEIGQQRMFGKIKRGYGKVRNAVKAVTTLPLNIVKSIKDISKKMDEADDERRKKYMTEPGFRKKVFRNMKLALMYQGVASANLALLPITIFARHASKQKNARIRNELYSEIMTEIKICDEKINDATGNDKYKLMRLKNKLENEAVRVRYNSKYI